MAEYYEIYSVSGFELLLCENNKVVEKGKVSFFTNFRVAAVEFFYAVCRGTSMQTAFSFFIEINFVIKIILTIFVVLLRKKEYGWIKKMLLLV